MISISAERFIFSSARQLKYAHDNSVELPQYPLVTTDQLLLEGVKSFNAYYVAQFEEELIRLEISARISHIYLNKLPCEVLYGEWKQLQNYRKILATKIAIINKERPAVTEGILIFNEEAHLVRVKDMKGIDSFIQQKIHAMTDWDLAKQFQLRRHNITPWIYSRRI